MAMAGNGIQPLVVAGDRIRRVIDANSEAPGVKDEAIILKRPLAKVSPRIVGRLDVANMALFPVAANGRNIPGQALSVCGNLEGVA
jgi:hypothetical protein